MDSEEAYNLNADLFSYDLPNSLKEISGIAFVNNKQFLCINDEKGILYKYDTEQSKIVSKVDFGKNKDYEDLAIVDKDVFILQSNGNLFKVEDFSELMKKKKAKTQAEKIEIPLGSAYDTEGLCFDKEAQKLYIACKAKAGKGKEYDHFKAIYAYDLEAMQFDSIPMVLLDLEKIRLAKRVGKTQETYDKVMEKMGQNNITFNPSALEIHPITKELYIIASSGNTLLVTDLNGDIKKTYHLDGKIFKQPEGLTFDKDGNMFISNEGRGGKANVKLFMYNGG
ncbi:MAG: SdiA-regulated domain-containing protein [Flavobacteriales bacterium]|nr:SdiA-regulated domain-containing protein [Flavobacteriales bacterium]